VEITRDALIAASRARDHQPLPSVGIMYFNSDDLCGIPPEPTWRSRRYRATRRRIRSSTICSSALRLSRPRARRRLWFHAERLRLPASAQSRLRGNLFVVLLTDGAETCDPGAKPFLVQKAEEASG